MFDFNLEVEPILQVLVGKSIEHARIEVIEEHEAYQLNKHKNTYKQQREAMLIQTQRLEARQGRRDDETDRRNLQQRVRQVLTIGKEKREIAKNFSKQYLQYFKRDTLQQMVDIGVLRGRREFSIGSHFVPLLYNQAELEGIETQERTIVFDDTLRQGLRARAKNHKAAIKAEF